MDTSSADLKQDEFGKSLTIKKQENKSENLSNRQKKLSFISKLAKRRIWWWMLQINKKILSFNKKTLRPESYVFSLDKFL